MYINNLLKKSLQKNDNQLKKFILIAKRFSRGNINIQQGRILFEQDKNNLLKITDKIDVKKILKINKNIEN